MKKLIFCVLCMLGCMQMSFAQSVKFAILADIHFDIMHDAKERLQVFLDAAKKADVDFIIDMGDFAHPKPANQYAFDMWHSFPGETYNVIGNHDEDNGCTKEDYVKYAKMKAPYYSFDKGDFHFIVLDPNTRYIDGKYVGYGAIIQKDQFEWLKNDLRSTDKRCVIFSHQSLEHFVTNRKEVRALLEAENERAGFKKVVAAFSGHEHTNYEKVINGIVYIQINSASNQWVGEDYKCERRFSKEINEAHPWLKCTVPYKDCLYAIVNINKKGLKLKGVESEFIAPTPEDLDMPTYWADCPLVPYIKDFKCKF